MSTTRKSKPAHMSLVSAIFALATMIVFVAPAPYSPAEARLPQDKADGGGMSQPLDTDSQALTWLRSIGAKVQSRADGDTSVVVDIDLLSNQEVTDDGLRHLKGLRQLTRLSLGDTQVGDKGLANLANLPKLLVLNLNATHISNEGLAHLQELPSVSHLFLANARVTDEGMKSLKKLPKLSVLHLLGSDVTGHGLQHLPNLASLSLGGPKVKIEELTCLKKLTRLREFQLLNAAITDNELQYLRHLPRSLTLLQISKTGLTVQAMESFQKDYPQTEFK
jgi:Leucine Rich repeat